jgi:hypothetical protein
VVEAQAADKAEPAATEAAPVAAAPPAAAPPAVEAPASAAAPTAAAAGADTLKADDKAIEPAPPAKTAALGEPAAAATPLPPKEVKIPNPRIDPAVIEARRQRLLAEQKARARAALARRAAAARARAAQAKAQAKAANDPFGWPANSTAGKAN